MKDLLSNMMRKEGELKLFRAVLEEFCKEVDKILRKAHGFAGDSEVISLLREISQKALFRAESTELEGVPAVKLHVIFPEEKLEYKTKPLGMFFSLEDMKLLPEEFHESVRGFIDFLLENLWKFLPHKCQAEESSDELQ